MGNMNCPHREEDFCPACVHDLHQQLAASQKRIVELEGERDDYRTAQLVILNTERRRREEAKAACIAFREYLDGERPEHESWCHPELRSCSCRAAERRKLYDDAMSGGAGRTLAERLKLLEKVAEAARKTYAGQSRECPLYGALAALDADKVKQE